MHHGLSDACGSGVKLLQLMRVNEFDNLRQLCHADAPCEWLGGSALSSEEADVLIKVMGTARQAAAARLAAEGEAMTVCERKGVCAVASAVRCVRRLRARLAQVVSMSCQHTRSWWGTRKWSWLRPRWRVCERRWLMCPL